jgi:hypothetical protein
MSLVRPPFSLVTPHLPFLYKESRAATCAPQDLTFGLFIWLFLGFFVHQLPFIHDGLVPGGPSRAAEKMTARSSPTLAPCWLKKPRPHIQQRLNF